MPLFLVYLSFSDFDIFLFERVYLGVCSNDTSNRTVNQIEPKVTLQIKENCCYEYSNLEFKIKN